MTGNFSIIPKYSSTLDLIQIVKLDIWWALVLQIILNHRQLRVMKMGLVNHGFFFAYENTQVT